MIDTEQTIREGGFFTTQGGKEYVRAHFSFSLLFGSRRYGGMGFNAIQRCTRIGRRIQDRKPSARRWIYRCSVFGL